MKNSGQAVLLLLLVVAVALGLGLAIMSQSTTDIRITEQEQQAARAFSAAEAGIEDALRQISGVSLGAPQELTVDNIPVEYTVTGQDFLAGRFSENESAQVILDGNANTLTINWVDAGNPAENPATCVGRTGEAPASLLITVVDGSYAVRRYGVNSCDGLSNGFTEIAAAGSGRYLKSYQLDDIRAGDQLVRIRPLYNLTSLRVTAANPLPNQAYLINSQASAPSEETKAIEVTRTEPATPSIFDYVLFSGGNLVQ